MKELASEILAAVKSGRLAEPFNAVMLKDACPGCPEKTYHVFPAKHAVGNGKETELCAEWKMYVEPELRRLFQTATETVAGDLEQLNGNEKSLANRTLRIPAKHADAWLSALNQARLVIAAKNNFTETELNDHLHSPIGSRRDLSLFQVNFYGFLQEFILREMES